MHRRRASQTRRTPPEGFREKKIHRYRRDRGRGGRRLLWCAVSAGWLLAITAPAWSQALSLRLDLVGTAAFGVRHPTLLVDRGYGVNDRFDSPDIEEVALHRILPEAEFVRIVIEATGGEIGGVRLSKVEEEFDLIIHQIAGTLTGRWYALTARISPPVPPSEEVRRRFTLAGEVFAAAKQALGLEDTAWRGWMERRRPAGQISTSEDLTREEAVQLLREGVGHLQAARNHFGITFGLGLAAFHIP